MMLLLALACTDDTAPHDTGHDHSGHHDSGDTGTPAQSGYAFTSALTGEPSVSYSGQVFRQLLIDDMKSWTGDLTAAIDAGEVYPAEGDVEASLSFYLDFDSSVGGQLPHRFTTDPGTTSSVYDDIGSGKNLTEKIAGNDATGQHKDWSTEFVGWDMDGVTTPESLVRAWSAELDELAAARVAGDIPLGPDATPLTKVHVTGAGHDLQQLQQKFLRGSIAFSQAADDYLDDDTDGKGLLSDHTVAEDGKPYTALEHAWDEGFGYFGAARTYDAWTDEEISAQYKDVDQDGAIDLLTEVNWGHSVNAGKRDAGAVAATDFTAQAYDGFYQGRALLAETAGTALTDAQLTELKGHRDQALAGWEAAIAATCVHYINDVLADTAAIGTDDYVFEDHAKHWSELKGFALALQFNPRSPVSDAEFAELHGYIGMAPVVHGDLDAVADDLRAARALLGTAYGFDASNLGDDDGQNGW